jgi:hypothetical protein
MQKGQLIDKCKFDFDEINIQTGVYLFEWTLGILSIQHQTIHIFGIDKLSGSFVSLRQIGPSVLDDDQLWDRSVNSENDKIDGVFTGIILILHFCCHLFLYIFIIPDLRFLIVIPCLILAFRQRFLAFLYKKHSANGTINQFLYEMDFYTQLKMQKIQFLGPELILIRMDLHRKGLIFSYFVLLINLIIGTCTVILPPPTVH